MQQLLKEEQRVEDRINERRILFIDLETDVVMKADEERNVLKAQIAEYKNKEKKRLLRRLKFDKVTWNAKAIPKSEVCEHLRTKAWGDNYAKGVRCKDCGKELSQIHHEKPNAGLRHWYLRRAIPGHKATDTMRPHFASRIASN